MSQSIGYDQTALRNAVDVAAAARRLRQLGRERSLAAVSERAWLRTARALGIRRQSLHARLDRLTAVLGAPVEDPAQLVGLGVALVGRQLRTGTDAQAGPARTPRPHIHPE